MLRWCGATVGKNVRIDSCATICGNGSLTIGDNVWIGAHTFIYAAGQTGVEICKDVDVGPAVVICNGTHEVDSAGAKIAGRGATRAIKIGEGSWLGVRSVILPGVTLAPRTLVAAGAVVAKSNERERTLLAGVPAKEVKSYVA